MSIHNVCFIEKHGKLSLNYHQIPTLYLLLIILTDWSEPHWDHKKNANFCLHMARWFHLQTFDFTQPAGLAWLEMSVRYNLLSLRHLSEACFTCIITLWNTFINYMHYLINLKFTLSTLLQKFWKFVHKY